FFEGNVFRNVGFVSEAIVRQATSDALEVSWYPNRFDRFHEVIITVPRDAFTTCVEIYDYDDKPHHRGESNSSRWVALRERIDRIANETPGIAFVSFADSLLVKANWFVGKYDSELSYSYDPEALVRLFPTISAAYREVLGLAIYAIITQGANEYPDPKLIH